MKRTMIERHDEPTLQDTGGTRRPSFGATCPVCGGPLLRKERGAGCVLCGYAVRPVPAPRLSSIWRENVERRQRPRQSHLSLQ
jgi:hypothetical protein